MFFGGFCAVTDAVELALPESAVAVSKLMGSGSFGGGCSDVRAGAEKVETGQAEGNSLIIQSSVDACSQRAKIPPAHASEPAFRYKIPDTRRFVPNGHPSSYHGGDTSEDLKRENFNASQSLIPGPEAKQLHQRSGKVARSNSGSLKRSRIVQLELSMNESGVEDIKGNASGSGSCPAKCIIAEKAQIPKQRNNSNGKRGDKKNGRAPKSRSDSFCLKNGLVSFSSVAGGGQFLAVYGSKSDIFDVTKPVDELPLNELLDGSYKRPSLVKDKGKAVQDSNENLLNSVRKACSLLRLDCPVPAQNSIEVDNIHNQVSTGPFSTGGSSTSRMDGGKADSCTVNQHSNNKDSFGDMKAPAFAVNSPLCPPKDILERLALPPSKELDSLLLDAVKPASSSRNATDLRLGKSVSNRSSLPPFTWSHNSSGHSKSGLDTVKLSANRTTCPGRWVKVGNTLTPSKSSNGLLVDLKSLTYNHRLVPLGDLESVPVGVENVSSKCVNISSTEQVVLSSATFSAFQVPAAEYSPRLLAAAETLCKIASSSSLQSSHETMKWLKKPSQKTIKACKLKPSQKSEILRVAPKASMGPDNSVKISDSNFTSKKLRLSADEKMDAACHTNLARKEPINWSAPRSIRSSPNKLSRESSVPDMKNYNNHIVKKSFMMPPSSRVPDRACNSRQKVKKIVSMEWNPTASNLD